MARAVSRCDSNQDENSDCHFPLEALVSRNGNKLFGTREALKKQEGAYVISSKFWGLHLFEATQSAETTDFKGLRSENLMIFHRICIGRLKSCHF